MPSGINVHAINGHYDSDPRPVAGRAKNSAERLSMLRRTSDALGVVEACMSQLTDPPGEQRLSDARGTLSMLQNIILDWQRFENEKQA